VLTLSVEVADDRVIPTKPAVPTLSKVAAAGARGVRIRINRSRTEHLQMPEGREIDRWTPSGREAGNKVRRGTARKGRPTTQAATTATDGPVE
jgi:hypothetical protein